MAAWFARFWRNAKPTWAVHLTANEPAPLLCAVAAHYLGLGASEVHICLDHPDPEAKALLSGVKGVRVTDCDAAYWAASRHSTRPLNHIDRQTHNANKSYKASQADWFLMADSDEFLSVDGQMSDVLAAADPRVGFFRIPVIERAFCLGKPIVTIFDGVFRRPVDGTSVDIDSLYSPYAANFTSGLMGHTVGKSIVRTRRKFSIGLHYPKKWLERSSKTQFLQTPDYQNWLPKVSLVHYYAMTPLHLVLKRLAKMITYQELHPDAPGMAMPSVTSGRKQQFRTIYENRTNAAVLRDVVRIMYLDDVQHRTLADAGLLAQVPFDPVADAKALFPNAQFDYSEAEFDERLVAIQADLIRKADFPIAEFLGGNTAQP